MTVPPSTVVLISCDEDSQPFAEAELRTLFSGLSPIDWLTGNPDENSGVGRLVVPLSFPEFAAKVEASGSVFLRHFAPVMAEVPLSDDDSDLPRLEEAARSLTPFVEATETLSVQARLLGDTFRPFSRTELNGALFSVIEAATGVVLDAREPVQTLSVVCARDRAFLGVSRTADNRSPWPGGQMRFKREDGQISRAEFKLMEAIRVFDLTVPDRGSALDIGAAPGGWTNVLRRFGLRVIAVDPAELHESLRHDRRIVHVRERIQRYRPSEAFEVIVNDLKMDARDSTDIMLSVRRFLKPGGFAVMTLKLPKTVPSPRAMREFVQDDLRRLRSGYGVIGARQLFHNRSEITVALTSD
ncbi:MAG: SAM-dependent methyltransferase [Capsulimonadales bacterium]|nr:SAM-dependent methyltransferase [Capsulimonadales bacterium]